MVPAQFLLLIAVLWNARERLRESPVADMPRYRVIYLLTVYGSMVVVGFVYPVLLNRVGRNVGLSTSVNKEWETFVQFAPYSAIALFVTLAAVCFKDRLLFGLAPLVIAASLGFISGLSLDNSRRHITYGHEIYLNLVGNDPVFAPPDLESVGQFVRERTPDGLILASNNYCCPGTQWWTDITEDIEGYVESGTPSRWGGDNHLVQAVTRRRVLMQGPADKDQSPDFEKINRMTLSIAFANAPTQKIVDELRDYGVNGFVVNTSLTARRDWSEFAVERYRNGNYIYLELR